MGSCSWQVCGAGNWILISQLEFEKKKKEKKGAVFSTNLPLTNARTLHYALNYIYIINNCLKLILMNT